MFLMPSIIIIHSVIAIVIIVFLAICSLVFFNNSYLSRGLSVKACLFQLQASRIWQVKFQQFL